MDLPDNVTLVTDGMDSTFRAKFTLVKASVERLLPTDVDHLVVTDIDVLWVGDICDAHGEIDAFADEAVFGLAPEQSNYYTGERNKHRAFVIPSDNAHRIPGKFGVNAGIQLIRLSRARAMNWTSTWAAYVSSLPERNPLPMGDQDVFNRFGQHDPRRIQVISQAWNQQLIKGLNCSNTWRGIYGIHGNDRSMKRIARFQSPWSLFSVFADATGSHGAKDAMVSEGDQRRRRMHMWCSLKNRGLHAVLCL